MLLVFRVTLFSSDRSIEKKRFIGFCDSGVERWLRAVETRFIPAWRKGVFSYCFSRSWEGKIFEFSEWESENQSLFQGL